MSALPLLCGIALIFDPVVVGVDAGLLPRTSGK